MKKFLAAVLFFPIICLAADFRLDENISLLGKEGFEEDLYAAGENIFLDQTILGDFIAAGKDVKISGKINQDANLIGKNLEISGSIDDDLRIIGKNIKITDKIFGDALIFGQKIDIEESAEISGDLFIIGQEVKIAGKIAGKTEILAKKVNVFGEIQGDAELRIFKTIKFFGQGKILGNAVIYGSETISPEFVNGKIFFYESTWAITDFFKKEDNVKFTLAILTGFFLFQFLNSIFLAAVLIYLFRKKILEFITLAKENVFQSMGKGIIAFLVFPIIMGILFPTIIGIFLGLSTTLFFIILIVIAKILSSFLVGSFFVNLNEKSSFWRVFSAFCLGKFFLILLFLVPILGWITRIIIFLVIFGNLVFGKMGIWQAIKKIKN